MQKFYITTPIYYPNARPHIGSAYTTIICDAIARYKRMCGCDVAFLTGTDEHGEKLQRAADAAGVPVEQFVAEKREQFKALWQALGIPRYSSASPAGYRFIHTSQNLAHRTAVQWMIRQANRSGYIEKKKYEGRYCIYDERYVSDSPEPANCDICGRPAELIREENYFFKLSEFQGRLLDLYDSQPGFVQPPFRMNEVKSFVKGGLRDISISRRRLKWGVPWPDDPEQVVYVWYDALTSYLTGIGFEGERRSPEFEKYWPADVHMIGKDILRFHAVYWPAFLWAAGLDLPKTIFAHGWIYYEQDKMSKSKGNVVYPEPVISAFDKFGAPGKDALRYYLLRDTPFGLDGSFSYDGLIQRYNSDLANDLGNLASRTITMLHQFCGGQIPPSLAGANKNTQLASQYREACDRSDFSSALSAIWGITSEANKLIVLNRPWELAKSASPDDKKKLEDTLSTAAGLLAAISVLLYPVAPDSANRIGAQLGEMGEIGRGSIDSALQFRALTPGGKAGDPAPIFPRLDKAAIISKLEELVRQDRAAEQVLPEVRKQMAEEHQHDLTPETNVDPGPEIPVSKPAPASATVASPKISIDDFAKIDLRAGQVISAEPIHGATKLLKLQVDLGTEVRQVCAGIAEYYKPEELVGKKVVLVSNLQPRKLRGIESNGMILAASAGQDGKPVLATFSEDVPNGTKLK